jgi:hypothetical protein
MAPVLARVRLRAARLCFVSYNFFGELIAALEV